MRQQLQQTTVVVLVLLVFLGGTLYLLDSSFFISDNHLTGATTARESDTPCPDVQEQDLQENQQLPEDCIEKS